MSIVQTSQSTEEAWDQLVQDTEFISQVILSFRQNNQPEFSLRVWKHLKELLPPLKTSGVNVDLARMYLQDIWFYKFRYEELEEALKDESQIFNSPEIKVLAEIREMLYDEDLLLSGIVEGSDKFSSIKDKISEFNSQQLNYFTQAATFGLK